MSEPVKIRKFLNRTGHHSLGAVYASFNRGDGTLMISDCSRQVTLSVEAYDRPSRANTLHKLEILAETIAALRAAVEDYKP